MPPEYCSCKEIPGLDEGNYTEIPVLKTECPVHNAEMDKYFAEEEK